MNNENMEFDNKKGSLKDEFCVWGEPVKANLENEISEEYVLPDYLPDIRKIVLVKVRLEQSEVYVEDGKAEVSGEAVFNVLYLGDSGELKCITQSYPYSSVLNNEGLYEDSVINVNAELKSRSVRALSSRKLLLKAKLVSEVCIRNKLCVSPRLIGGSGVSDEFTLERKVNEIMSTDFVCFTESDIRISEDIEYKGREPIGELIAYDADVYTTECKCAGGKLVLKGMAKVWCVIACSAGEDKKDYEVIEKNIPINHISDSSVDTGDKCCVAKLDIGAFECGVANDSYGEARVLEVDIACRASIVAISNEKSIFTDDVFSTAYAYTNEYRTINTERLSKCAFSNFSASGSGEIQINDSDEYDKVIMSNTDVEMSFSDLKDGKLVFNGECIVKSVIEDKAGGLINSDFSFPIRFEAPCENIENFRCECRCNVIDSRVALDGNKVNANVEIGVNYTLFERLSVKTVESIAIDKSCPNDSPCKNLMILYYPEKGETVWSIAKKYNVSRADLERANNRQLSEGLPRVIVIPTHIS